MGYSKMARKLALYTSVLKSCGCAATFPITASLLRTHKNLITDLGEAGIEIASHGHDHLDLTKLSREEQQKQIERARQTFKHLQLPLSGFRSPYLRWNSDTVEAIGRAGFSYSSNRSLLWDLAGLANLSQGRQIDYIRASQFYGAKNVDGYLSLPRFIGEVIDIPVSLPDDEMLVERLRLTNGEQIERIWSLMLDMSHERGELFTLQLHPERIGLCHEALKGVLERAISIKPGVWIARLCEIADWYREKRSFSASIQERSNLEFQVDLYCSERATVLVRNLEIQSEMEPWYGYYKTVRQRCLVFRNGFRPVIGVPEDSPHALLSFLRQEGYIIEISDRRSDYQIYLDGLKDFSPEMELGIVRKIERENLPLIRFWRWPCKARSALAVTGDIDSVTVSDFVWRFLNGIWSCSDIG